MERWYGRPVAAMCVLLAVAAVALFFLPRVELGHARGGPTGWVVTLEHFGVDSEEVERSITEPLETEFGRLGGVSALRSVSEYGKARVTVETREGTDNGAFFLALSDAVERVASELPSSVQKPRIVPSSNGKSPAFIAVLDASGSSLDELRDWVERRVKPALEKRPGVGEVEVGGGLVKEVRVVADEARLARRGVGFEAVALALQTQGGLFPAGTFTQGRLERSLSVRGRFGDLASVGEARVGLPGGESLPVNDLAAVGFAGREADTVSRVDGAERVVLLVYASGTANPIALSREMASALGEFRGEGMRFRVLVDEGQILAQALGETVRALAEGLGAVLLVLPFLARRGRLAAALVLVLSLVVTTAVLGAAGKSVDPFVLAGYAVGLGTVLDFVLLTARAGPKGLDDLFPSLATGLAITLLFLAPLAFLDFVWPGIRTLVSAVGLLLVVSFALAALFLPVLPGAGADPRGGRPWKLPQALARCARSARRLAARLVGFSIRRPRLVTAASAALAIGGAALLAALGVSLDDRAPAREVAVHVEFEPEASLASVDARTVDLVRRFRAVDGVTGVQSLARRGSTDLTVAWDGTRNRGDLAQALADAGRPVPGAFVYLPEGSAARTTPVTVTLNGDDHQRLRTLAKAAARELSAAGVGLVVLNFKDAPRRLAVRLDHAKVAAAGTTAAEVASALRWNLWGPVAMKWLDGDHERDLRVVGSRSRNLTRGSLMDLPLVGTRRIVKLASVAQLVEEPGGAKLYHENRQRSVSLTVETTLRSARAITAAVGSALTRVVWPPGYAYRVDPRLAEQESRFGWVLAALLVSLLLVGMVLTARTQSLGAAPLTLAMVPVALAFPVAAAALGGFTVPVLLGLVLLAGTVVNNAVLVVDSVRARPQRSVFAAVRHRLVPLVLTNLTAVLGALPLVVAGPPGGLLPTLAGLVVWGALGASLSTVTTIPALLTLFPRALSPVSITPAEVHP